MRVAKFWYAATAMLVFSAAVIPFDTLITANRRADFLAGDIRRIIQLSEIFGHGFGIAIAIYFVWRMAPAKRKWVPRLLACVLLPGLIVHLFKLCLARRRPGFYYPEFVDNVSDTWLGWMPSGHLNHEYLTQSFPSAHTATAFGLAAGLAWMFPRCKYTFFVFASIAAFQRIVYGAHWASDVFFGAAIGLVAAAVIFRSGQINSFFLALENKADPVGQENDADISDIRRAA